MVKLRVLQIKLHREKLQGTDLAKNLPPQKMDLRRVHRKHAFFEQLKKRCNLSAHCFRVPRRVLPLSPPSVSVIVSVISEKNIVRFALIVDD